MIFTLFDSESCSNTILHDSDSSFIFNMNVHIDPEQLNVLVLLSDVLRILFIYLVVGDKNTD